MDLETPSPQPIRARLSLWAIVLGTVADIVLTFVSGMLFLPFVDQDLIAALVFGLAMTVIGGYIAAAVAGRRSLAHGLGVGILSTLGGFALSRVGSSPIDIPFWYQVLAYGLTIPAAVAGSWVRRRFWGERLPSVADRRSGVYPNLAQAIWLAVLLVLISSIMAAGAGLLAIPLAFVESWQAWIIPAIFASVAAGYVLVLAWAARKAGAPAREIFPVARVSAAWLWPALGTIAGLGIMLGEVSARLQRAFPPPRGFDLINLFSGTEQSWWAAVAFIVVVGPIAEELLFRGVILRGFLSRYTVRKAVVVSALLFGAFHLNPVQFVTATMLGVIFAWWRVHTGSLILPFLGHALNNSLALGLPRVNWAGVSEAARTALPLSQPVWFDVLGLLLFVIGVVQFFRLIRARSAAGSAPVYQGAATDVSSAAATTPAGPDDARTGP